MSIPWSFAKEAGPRRRCQRGWINEQSKDRVQQINDAEPFLKEIGIEPSELVREHLRS